MVPYEPHALLICLPCASETSREHTTGFHVSLTYANVCEKRYVRMAFSCVIYAFDIMTRESATDK